MNNTVNTASMGRALEGLVIRCPGGISLIYVTTLKDAYNLIIFCRYIGADWHDLRYYKQCFVKFNGCCERQWTQLTSEL